MDNSIVEREMLELAAKAAGYEINFEEPVNDWYPHGYDEGGDVDKWWNPLLDDGDALRLAVKLRINIMFNGGFHHVGLDRWVSDICCLGGMAEIRRAIVRAAAEIGRAMP